MTGWFAEQVGRDSAGLRQNFAWLEQLYWISPLSWMNPFLGYRGLKEAVFQVVISVVIGIMTLIRALVCYQRRSFQ